MAKKEQTERVTLNSSVVDDGRGQNHSVNPSFTDLPPDPAGLIPKEEVKRGKD